MPHHTTSKYTSADIPSFSSLQDFQLYVSSTNASFVSQTIGTLCRLLLDRGMKADEIAQAINFRSGKQINMIVSRAKERSAKK